MLTLFTLGLICLAAVVAIPVVLFLVGLPFLLLLGLVPWLLRIAGVVLLIKALMDQPVRWESFLPAIAAFGLSVLLGRLFCARPGPGQPLRPEVLPAAGDAVEGVLPRPQLRGGQGGPGGGQLPGAEAQGDAAAQGDLPQHRHGHCLRHGPEDLLGIDGGVGGDKGDECVVHHREITLPAFCIRATMSYMLLTAPTWSCSVRP